MGLYEIDNIESLGLSWKTMYSLWINGIPFSPLTLLVGRQEGLWPVKSWMLMVTIWLRLCTSYSAVVTTILSSNTLTNLGSPGKTDVKRCVCVCVCVSLYLRDNSKSCRQILINFHATVGWLDFSVNQDHDRDTGTFYRNYYHGGIGLIRQILLITREVDKFLFVGGAMSY